MVLQANLVLSYKMQDSLMIIKIQQTIIGTKVLLLDITIVWS